MTLGESLPLFVCLFPLPPFVCSDGELSGAKAGPSYVYVQCLTNGALLLVRAFELSCNMNNFVSHMTLIQHRHIKALAGGIGNMVTLTLSDMGISRGWGLFVGVA